MPVCGLFISIADTQDDILGQGAAQYLKTNRQAIYKATGQRHTAQSGQVQSNGENVTQIHL